MILLLYIYIYIYIYLFIFIVSYEKLNLKSRKTFVISISWAKELGDCIICVGQFLWKRSCACKCFGTHSL